jgi:hypothetical protein
MKKLVRLTESDLVRIIEKVISEQDTVGGNFQQGVQSGQQAGQQARQVVNKVAGDVAQGAKKVGTAAVQAGVATLQGAKQVAITIGKVTFYAVITGGVVVFLIGKGIYKVSAAVGNAIIKFLAATGKATVSAATASSATPAMKQPHHHPHNIASAAQTSAGIISNIIKWQQQTRQKRQRSIG